MMESNKSGATIQLSKYVKIGFYLVGLVCVCVFDVLSLQSFFSLSLFLSFSFFDQCVSIPLKRWFKYGPKTWLVILFQTCERVWWWWYGDGFFGGGSGGVLFGGSGGRDHVWNKGWLLVLMLKNVLPVGWIFRIANWHWRIAKTPDTTRKLVRVDYILEE